SIISMGLTPFLMNYADRITYFLVKLPIPVPVRKRLDNLKKSNKTEGLTLEELHDHLVIIGYGINGQNISKAAKNANIPYVITDLEPDAFEKAKKAGEPIVFGDATNPVI